MAFCNLVDKLKNTKLQDLKDSFNMFDADGSGYINSNELKNVIKVLKIDLDDACIDYLMGLMDKDKSGHIDFSEFSAVMLDSIKSYPKLDQNELKKSFAMFDTDKSGSISEMELYITMRKFRPNVTKEEIKKLFKQIDVNKDNKISLEEFASMISDDYPPEQTKIKKTSEPKNKIVIKNQTRQPNATSISKKSISNEKKSSR